MDIPQTEYRSYLLRLWRLSEEASWHVMLEQVGSQERRTFADLESLLEFLREGERAPTIESTPLSSTL